MFLYCIFTFPSAFAKNVATLNIGRAIAGFCASSCMTVIGGIISDLFDSAERGKPMALFSGTVFMGPCIGPIIAGFRTSCPEMAQAGPPSDLLMHGLPLHHSVLVSAKGWRANYVRR
jgi:MFS family permease